MTKGKKILAHAVLILASFLSVFPLYYMLCGATNPSIDVVRGKLIPGTYLMENFKSLIANQNLGLAMANSFRNAILMTFITLLVCMRSLRRCCVSWSAPSPVTALRSTTTRPRTP